jgi:hypothetical protein
MSRIDFDSDIESKIASASIWGQGVAICSVLTAALALPLPLGNGEMLALPGLGVQLALGVALFIASRAFGKVARTDDDDHGHLATGFRHLRVYFLIQAILIVLLVCVMMSGIVAHTIPG